MSELKVDAIVNLAGTGKPNFPVSPTHSGGSALSTLNTHSYTSSGTEPSSPKNGALWWDSGNDKVMVYIAGEFKEISLNASAVAPVNYGDRGFQVGTNYGAAGSRKQINYWDMTTSSNAADFGDLSRDAVSQFCSSSASKIFVGGSADNKIMTFNSATLGNSTDHCNMNSRTNSNNGTSQTDGSVGIQAHGAATSYSNYIDTFSTTTQSNATSFGTRTTSTDMLGSMANATRMVMGGGRQAAVSVNIMDYITFANAGNATDFGDLTTTRSFFGGAGSGSGTKGVWMGGGNQAGYLYNICEYITIDTAGNATDHGDLPKTQYYNGVCNNATKGHSVGGYTDAYSNEIFEITLDTTGNATDFGDLLRHGYLGQCASGSAS